MREREEMTDPDGDKIGISGLMQLSDREFRMLSELVHVQSGITLGEHKRSLIVGRLNKELRQKGFETFAEYYDYVVHDNTGQALGTLIEKISTNHTFFWRESAHFDFLVTTALPELTTLLRKRNFRDLRVWCAGCSTGEEPYTIAMLLQTYLGPAAREWDAGILATDISDRVLETTRAGIYLKENIAKLPPRLRNSYFEPVDEECVRVRKEIRERVLFRKLNLMRENFPFRGRFHVIFCRNVMIYFDASTRAALVRRFHQYMEMGGYLFTGHSESLGRTDCPFGYVCPAVYRKDRE